jgi:hypothetical protein
MAAFRSSDDILHFDETTAGLWVSETADEGFADRAFFGPPDPLGTPDGCSTDGVCDSESLGEPAKAYRADGLALGSFELRLLGRELGLSLRDILIAVGIDILLAVGIEVFASPGDPLSKSVENELGILDGSVVGSCDGASEGWVLKLVLEISDGIEPGNVVLERELVRVELGC